MSWEKLVRAASSEQEFGEIFAKDYYRADSYALDGGAPQRSFRLATAQTGMLPVGRFSGYGVGVRRTWSHIRQGLGNFYLVWFPIDGSLSITQDEAHGETVSRGQMAITCADRPFHIKALAAQGQSLCSNIHVMVPKHLMCTHLPEIDRLCGRVYDAASGVPLVVQNIFLTLFREADNIAPQVASELGHAALETLIGHIRRTSRDSFQRDPRQGQLEKLLNHIRDNLATQGLTADRVARGCNISPRYLHYLMTQHHMTFSEFLRDCRLRQARIWLEDADYDHFAIVDIAYMAGFTSGSHFSQCYRDNYGVSPRETRQSAEARRRAG